MRRHVPALVECGSDVRITDAQQVVRHASGDDRTVSLPAEELTIELHGGSGARRQKLEPTERPQSFGCHRSLPCARRRTEKEYGTRPEIGSGKKSGGR